mmetsp:Transcript_18397/g.27547  ORF Transcript_18397/g.27547 Transcript_18397/m.27547 type:complete len:919 (-) Transcript_18397:104-2860(-)
MSSSSRRSKHKKKSKKEKKGPGNDSRYFSSTKKGEIAELKMELNDLNEEVVKDAVKKVIASMTVGKDVSALFPDVLKRMTTNDVELKKLVYLYIITYARSSPKVVLLSVNSFTKDAKHRSPLIRALVIRTIGCIRLPDVVDYFCPPLQEGLKDSDPYVRKTAAVCVAKLYDVSPEAVEDHGFLKTLRGLISDNNAMVVANAVAALAEIAESTSKDVFKITPDMLNKLLAAMNECTEWGQVSILDCLSKYNPTSKQAETVVERVVPRLIHANSAVSLSAVKVIIKYLDVVENKSMKTYVIREKVPNPLITILSGDKPELQYIALRNINLILQKEKRLLDKHIRHFFCKYNDPLYVKVEKLEVMARVANNDNYEKLLMELRSYGNEVDETFVRKAISTIGRVAVKLDVAARKCMRVLLDFVKTNPGGSGEGKDRNVGFVAQNSVAVMADILRKYPGRFEKVVDIVCRNGIEGFDEEKPQAAMIWIIGEYAAIISKAPDYLQECIDNFDDMDTRGQLALLTSTVKLFLKRPEDGKGMVQELLKKATNVTDNADLRDRAYVYWRMLAADAKVAQQVILAEKPKMTDDTGKLDPTVLKTLLSNLATLASVYHKPPELFIKDGKQSFEMKGHSSRDVDDEDDSEEDDEEEDDEEEDEEEEKVEYKKKKRSNRPERKQDGMKNIFGDMMDGDRKEPESQKFPVVLPASKGKGVQINAGFSRRGGSVYLELIIKNTTSTVLDQFQVKFNKNFIGATPAGGSISCDPVHEGSTGSASHKININSSAADASKPLGSVQIALKTKVGVLYFTAKLGVEVLFQENGTVSPKDYMSQWKSLPSDEAKMTVASPSITSPPEIKSTLTKSNVFFVASRRSKDKSKAYLYFSLILNTPVLVELMLSGSSISGAAKSSNLVNAKNALDAIANLLK